MSPPCSAPRRLRRPFAFAPRLAALALLAACGPGDELPPKTPAPRSSLDAPPRQDGGAGVAAGGHRAPKPPVALEEYFKTKRLGGLSFSFDEKLVAFISDEGGRLDLYVRPIAGGAATQITRATGFVHSFRFSPKADLLAYEVDDGGDELPKLWLTNAKGAAPKAVLADLPKGRRTQLIKWSDDGKRLYFLSNARDERAMDLYAYDVKAGTAAVVWQADGKLAFEDIDKSGGRVVVTETRSDADNDVLLVDVKAPDKRTLLTAHTGDVLHDVQSFSPDGKALYLTSNEGSEFARLVRLDLATKKSENVRQETWDVEVGVPSASGRYLVSSSNLDGEPRMTLTDLRTKTPVVLPTAPRGAALSPMGATRSGPWFLGFSASERYLGVSILGDTTPAAPAIVDLKEKKLVPVADPLPASLRGRDLATARSVQIPSFDGKNVPAFLYAPPGEGPFPAVIDVHGGPTAQSRRTFSAMRQYLVSKGYVVLVPNVRGSTGYGKTWTQLDNLDLGGGPLDDVVACKAYLVAHAKVAPEKVVVMGGSYGGYMALAAATFRPETFAAHVDYFGVSDMKSLVESFPPYWASFASYIYQKFGDPKNPAHAQYQHDRSPLFFAAQIRRPLLVVQGEKDARVKVDQSERLVAAARGAGVPVHYLLLAGEGHGFSKNENVLRVSQLTDRFLDRYVLGDATVVVDEAR